MYENKILDDKLVAYSLDSACVLLHSYVFCRRREIPYAGLIAQNKMSYLNPSRIQS